MGFTEFSFTPSEYILLNGEKFASEGLGKNAVPLLYNDTLVDGYVLAKVMLTAAILANESESTLKLDLIQKKGIFTSTPKKELTLNPVITPVRWNGYTLETTLLVVLTSIKDSHQETTISNLVNKMLAEGREEPWKKVIALVEWGLASSNWLIPVQGDALGAFSTPFICPARVRDLAIAQPEEPVISLLENCRMNRPEIWQVLLANIEQSLKEK